MTRRAACALVALAALLVLGAAAPAAADVARYRACAPVRDIGPTGMDPADAYRVRALKTTWRTAARWRALPRARSSAATRTTHACAGAGAGAGDTPQVICRARGGKRIRFRDDG